MPQKQGIIAESHAGGGVTTAASLSPNTTLTDNRKSPLRAGPHMPYAKHQKRP